MNSVYACACLILFHCVTSLNLIYAIMSLIRNEVTMFHFSTDATQFLLKRNPLSFDILSL